MATALQVQQKSAWMKVGWFAALALVCYAPILKALIINWGADPDMGHGFFVPLISGFIIWQRRDELLAMKARPSWWGLPLVLLGAFLAIAATLGVELFLSRLAIVVTLTGMVWLIGGTLM